MVRTTVVFASTFVAIFASTLFAQSYASAMDMFFGDWRTSTARITHGNLEERDILTRGDGLKPLTKGAVLRFLNSYTFATLAPHASTKPVKLDGQQEIFYIASGQGTITGGGEKTQLHKNSAVLAPANLEFSLTNTGAEPMTMYLVNEPLQPGFRPNEKLLIKDENLLPIVKSSGFWDHLVKQIFVSADGLSTLESFLTVTLDPVTIGQPHLVKQEDIEEVWTGLDGTSLAFIGTQLRRQGPGQAYIHPPNHEIPHSNLNYSEEEQVKLLYFARYHPHENRP